MSSVNREIGEPADVAVVPGVIEANVRKAMLESYGIPVMFKGQAITSWRPVNSGPLGEITLMVPASRAEEARALLEEWKTSEGIAAEEGEYDSDASEDTGRPRSIWDEP